MPATKILLYDYPASICSQMARLCLVEKGVAFERRTVDIMVTSEQFEPWYTALNPRAVVPTMAIGEEIITDTLRIVGWVDQEFPGPSLTPTEPESAATMNRMMAEIMGLHYGVLLYTRRLDSDGISATVVARGEFLREQRAKFPQRAELLDRRIAGNEKLQAILASSAETEWHIEQARALVGRIDAELADRPFVCGDRYTLADTFATPALARFRLHGFEGWWSGGENANVAAYYERMKSRPSWSNAEVLDAGSERDL